MEWNKIYIHIEKKYHKKQHKNKNDVRKGNSTIGPVHGFLCCIIFHDCCQFQDKLFVYESFGLWSILIKVLDPQTVGSTWNAQQSK